MPPRNAGAGERELLAIFAILANPYFDAVLMPILPHEVRRSAALLRNPNTLASVEI
jgi:hypothetical protein